LKTIVRVFLLLFFLFAAIAFYAFGIPAGGAVFLLLGIVLEGLFWFGLFGAKKRQPSIH